MPKRSNEFQELVLMVKHHMSEGAKVTESMELEDLITGDKREVDVVVESQVAGHRVLVGIECRDHSRPQTIGFVEEMHDKHSRLPTNVLVLASSTGFTKAARSLAEKYGIETVTLGAIPDDFGTAVEGRIRAVTLALVETGIRAVEAIVDTDAGLTLVKLLPDNDIVREDGEKVCSAHELGEWIVNEGIKPQVPTLGREHKSFFMDMEPGHAPGDTLVPIFLAPLHGQGLHRILRVRVGGEMRVRLGDLPLRYGDLQGTGVTYGTAVVEGEEYMLVVTQDDVFGEKATVRVKQAKTATAKEPAPKTRSIKKQTGEAEDDSR